METNIMVAVASESVQNGVKLGVFSLGVPVDALFFIGKQLVVTSYTAKVGLWNAVS